MNEIEPKVLKVDEIAALLKEAEELPNPARYIKSSNQRAMAEFCLRLAEALAGEHLTANLTRHRRDDLFSDGAPHHDYMKRLIRLADNAVVSLEDTESVHGLEFADQIACIEELRDALKREMSLRRDRDAPHPCTPINTDGMSPLARQILMLLDNYCLNEARLSDGGGYPLVDALTLTDLTVAQGEREIATLAGHLAAALEEWSRARLAENPAMKNVAMKMAGCGSASDDPAEFRHRVEGPAFDRVKMEAAINEEMRFFRGGKDHGEWTRRRRAAAVAAEGFIFKMIEFGHGPIAAAAGAVAAAAKIGGGFTDKNYLAEELAMALSVGLAAAPKVSEEERLAALRAVVDGVIDAGNI
jgi:hypothetical protein